MTTRARAILGVFAALALSAGDARAALITWVFEGTLRTAPASIPSALRSLGVEVGAPVSGFLQFESTTPNQSSDPATGSYLGAVFRNRVTIGQWTSERDVDAPTGSLFVHSEPGVVAGAFADIDGADPTATYLRLIWSLELWDADGSYFPDTSLPLTPPPLSALDR